MEDSSRKLTLAERFWNKVNHTGGPETCWPWLGKSRDASGYGVYNPGNKNVRVHRLAWKLANDQPVPDGLTIDHTCRNKLCCNPDHLEPVTVEENSRRAAPFKASRGQPTEARFWAQADTSGGPDACWVWKNESLTLWDSEIEKSTNPRRFIYQLKVGPIPDRKRVRKRCGELKCVNYQHLIIRGEMQETPAPSYGQLAFTI